MTNYGLTDILKRFISDHLADNTLELLLSSSRYPNIDMPLAVRQIEARRQIKDKLPSWYNNEALIYPAKIAAEQCSSEKTALYKQRLVEADMYLCDLTGGLGVDSYFFSRKVKKVTYIERFTNYYQASITNFASLGVTNIESIEGDCSELIEGITHADVFYIDPARRDKGNKRMFALSDCEPELPQLLPRLLEKAPLVIAKLSPMADIRLTQALLPGTREIHIISVKNECKELLFCIGRNRITKPILYCINFVGNEQEQSFLFTEEEEKSAPAQLTSRIGAYLYEPNASLLKAGAFKTVGIRFGLDKLHTSSHLYTSDREVYSFPGRTFAVEEVINFDNKTCKSIYRSLPQANLTVRNFPLSVEQLRKKTNIAEGGEVYLFATTLADNNRVLIRCRKISVR